MIYALALGVPVLASLPLFGLTAVAWRAQRRADEQVIAKLRGEAL